MMMSFQVILFFPQEFGQKFPVEKLISGTFVDRQHCQKKELAIKRCKLSYNKKYP